MNLDIQTLNRLRNPSTTEKVLTRAKLNGRSHWSIRVSGQVIVVGDRIEAVKLYDQALNLGASPTLLNNGQTRDRSKFD